MAHSDSAIGFQVAGQVLDKAIYESFRDSEEIRMAFFLIPMAFRNSFKTGVSIA